MRRQIELTKRSSDSSLTNDLLDLKLEAVEKYESQIGFIVDRVGRELLRESMRQEHYRGAVRG